MENILYLFHHIHHEGENHAVHHCGREHRRPGEKIDYAITHCVCGKHSIDKETAVGHSIDADLKLLEIEIEFLEKCPVGGWHIESGIKL